MFARSANFELENFDYDRYNAERQRDYVQITKINEVSTIEVWNAMRGRVLTQRAAGDTEQIDVRNLPKGVYIIVLKEGESIVAETKVLIQ